MRELAPFFSIVIEKVKFPVLPLIDGSDALYEISKVVLASDVASVTSKPLTHSLSFGSELSYKPSVSVLIEPVIVIPFELISVPKIVSSEGVSQLISGALVFE